MTDNFQKLEVLKALDEHDEKELLFSTFLMYSQDPDFQKFIFQFIFIKN